ncbi:MAG: hypothetical protein MUC96_26295 [Myxococcaceae bacterium]|jgi:hypothetical protein|nr:hypothetical protein [Myxococcaceae bacterium]
MKPRATFVGVVRARWALLSMILAAPCLADATVVLRSVSPAPAFEASLTEMLGRLQVTLTRAANGEPLAFLDADLTSGQLVIDSPSRGVTIRRGLAPELVGEVRVETAAALVAAAVEVLLHTDPPRQPMKVTAPTPAEPAVAPRPPSRVGLELGVGLGPRLIGGSSVVDFGASLQALLTVPIGLQVPGVLLAVSYQPGFDLVGDAVALRGQLVSPRLFLQLELVRGRFGRLEAGAGGGVDVFSLARFQREGELLRPAERRLAVAPIISGLLTWRLPVGESVNLFASLTVDGDLRAPRAPPPMAGMEGDDPRPWTVRPMLQLGVSFAPLRTTR